jgi:hypothetical protein
MRLPQRERQVAQPVEQPVQPIEQGYDFAGAKVDAKKGQLMQAVGEMAKSRAEQLDLQFRNAVINQGELFYAEQASKKKTELLARQGFDAKGVVHDFNVYHNELAQKLLPMIENPEDREQVRVRLEKSRIQEEDQLAGHQVVQIRKADTEVREANNKLDLMAVFQYPTDDNILARSLAVESRIMAGAQSEGIAPEVAKLQIAQYKSAMLTGVVEGYLKNDDYKTAQTRLDAHADMLGGKDSAQFKAIDVQVKDGAFKFELSTEAEKIVTANFKDPDGLTKAYQSIESRKLAPDKRDLLLQAVGQKWRMLQAEVQVRTDRAMDKYGLILLDYDMKMQKGEITPQQAMKFIMPQIDKLLLEDGSKLDKGSILNLKKQFAASIEKRTNQLIARESAAANRQIAAETKRATDEAKRLRIETKNQEIDLQQTLIRNPEKIWKLSQMIQGWPLVDIRDKKALADFFGVFNNLNADAGTVPKKYQKLLDAAMAGLNPDEQFPALVQLSKYANAGLVSFNDKFKIKPNQDQIDEIFAKALKETAVDKTKDWWGAPHYRNFELSQVVNANGKEWRRDKNGDYWEVSQKTGELTGRGVTERELMSDDGSSTDDVILGDIEDPFANALNNAILNNLGGPRANFIKTEPVLERGKK